MASEEPEGEGIGGFGIGIHELLRYGYAGFLAFALSGVMFPTETEEEIERLGKVVAPIVAIVIGAAIYVIYRQTVGLALLYGINRIWLMAKYTVLTGIGVSWADSFEAFRLIRDSRIGGETIWKGFWREHSELHIAHLTAFELFVAMIVDLCRKDGGHHAVLFFVGFVIFAVAALLGDWLVNRREAKYLRRLMKSHHTDVMALLKDAGCLS